MDPDQPILQGIIEQSKGCLHALFLAKTNSTSDELKKMAAEGKLTQPTVLLTDNQTSGRGTRGRRWFQVPSKDIAFSLAIPFEGDDLHDPRISLAIGAMVANTLESALRAANSRPKLAFSLKWPNDILLGDPPKKCGGILIETGSGWMVIGVGINLNSLRGNYPGGIASAVSSIREELGQEFDIVKCTHSLVLGLTQALGVTQRDKRQEVELGVWLREWCKRDCTGGKKYLLSRASCRMVVVAQGVEKSTGGLQCLGENGQEYVVTSYYELEEI